MLAKPIHGCSAGKGHAVQARITAVQPEVNAMQEMDKPWVGGGGEAHVNSIWRPL